MKFKMEKDQEFLSLKDRIYDLKVRQMERRMHLYGTIEPLKDKMSVKIGRDLLNELLNLVEEADSLRGALFHFLRVEQYVSDEVPSIARSEIESYESI